MLPFPPPSADPPLSTLSPSASFLAGEARAHLPHLLLLAFPLLNALSPSLKCSCPPSFLAGEARATTLFDGEVSEEALKTFFLGERLPLTIEFTQENAQRIFSSGIYQQVGRSQAEAG